MTWIHRKFNTSWPAAFDSTVEEVSADVRFIALLLSLLKRKKSHSYVLRLNRTARFYPFSGFLLSRTPCIVYIFFFKFGLYASCRANPSPLRFNILLQPCLRVRDRFRWRFIGFGCEPCRQRNTLSRIVFLFSIYMSVIRMQCYASVRKAFIIHLSFIQSNM